MVKPSPNGSQNLVRSSLSLAAQRYADERREPRCLRFPSARSAGVRRRCARLDTLIYTSPVPFADHGALSNR
jgi:hypothetical protein